MRSMRSRRHLEGRFPENRILSHDLLEGCYARSGLLSDVHLYEEYPSRYSADVSRRHRWIRGDWQLVRWLLPRVPGFGGRRLKNPLSVLSLWKIFDNLRRSLIPAALTLLLLLGWTVLSPLWFWTPAAIGIILIPHLVACVLDLLQKPSDVRLNQHLAATMGSASKHFAQAAFTLACLPYEAFFSLDAIVRTVGRMLFTHRRLLEWMPSGDLDGNSRRDGDLARFCRRMWVAPALATAAAIYLTISRPAAWGAAGPILGLWFASPVIAWWISRPLARRAARLTTGQTVFLRKLSRKTWKYFETFVGPRGSLAAARQLPGASRRQTRSSHLTNQHWTCATRELVGVRLRLHFGRTTHRAHGECIRHDGNVGTPPRPLLQLVRHTVLETAVAHVHFDRRQREPRRSPADTATGAARDSRSEDPGCAIV